MRCSSYQRVAFLSVQCISCSPLLTTWFDEFLAKVGPNLLCVTASQHTTKAKRSVRFSTVRFIRAASISDKYLHVNHMHMCLAVEHGSHVGAIASKFSQRDLRFEQAKFTVRSGQQASLSPQFVAFLLLDRLTNPRFYGCKVSIPLSDAHIQYASQWFDPETFSCVTEQLHANIKFPPLEKLFDSFSVEAVVSA